MYQPFLLISHSTRGCNARPAHPTSSSPSPLSLPPAALPASQLARVSQGLALARTSARLAQEAVARSSRPLPPTPGAVSGVGVGGVPEGAGLPPTPYVAETMAALQEAAQELGPQVGWAWERDGVEGSTGRGSVHAVRHIRPLSRLRGSWGRW